MIYLTSGANGAGKTLFTLADVRKAQLAESRPVYYNGFEMDEVVAESFGWQKFDPKKWQDLPDGSICIMDECQNEFPVRQAGSKVPDYVNAVAQFRRKRGFDFYMITPHPRLVDVFIRSLIESPSWHRHFKRTFGADMVSELKFNAVEMQPHTASAAERAQVTMRAYPKEVYKWYRSASLHTGKAKLPRAVYVLAVCAVVVPLLFWYVFGSLMARAKGDNLAAAKPAASAPAAVTPTVRAPAAPPAGAAAPLGVSVDDYVAMHRERVVGLPYTAPRYDAVTAPVDAPYPAACVVMGKRCDCYTQQATKLQTPADVCRQIAANGFFIPWLARPAVVQTAAPATVPVAASPAPAQAAMPPTPVQASAIAPTGVSEGASTRGAALPRLGGHPAAVVPSRDGTVIGAMRSGQRAY